MNPPAQPAERGREGPSGRNQCIARRKVLEPEVRGWLGGVKAKPAAKK
ncbi:MAG TPA: hypothetical protein VFP84_34700 [Kofleriaceae bacterium]|nr:hypothetical protein [Kofleriaceae bacterium]